MGIEANGFNREKLEEIEAAANGEWEFEEWDDAPGTLAASGEGSLCGGEQEKEFARRLARAMFKANGEPFGLTVTATYLDCEPPSEDYSFDENDTGLLE